MKAGLDPLAAWESVKTGGLLLAPARLAEVFPQALEPLQWKTIERLRRAVVGLNGHGAPTALLDVVLEEVLGLGTPLEPDTGHWLKGSGLGSEWTHRALSGEAIKPQRVWQGEHGAELPVFLDGERRLGIGRGRRMPARVVEWLRAGERSLALLTNGWQWRLIHASLDADAFAEWDVGLWFEEGEPGPQVAALRALLDHRRLTPPAEGTPAPLLAAIAASRKGQGELSAALGERVRLAVELLVQRVFREAELPYGLDAGEATRRQLYRAATRVVMRMVVILFAEARDGLLPRDNPVYHLSYGLQGLREALQQAGAGTRDGLARLAHRQSAWPRVLALFRLLYHGSPHKDLTLIRYGGGLFEAGDPASDDPLRRALAALEDPARAPHDADVYRILDLLCVTEMRTRQGTGWKRVNVPVDFSDLSSEYIGILYEGLLDYELRRADAGDPIVFLALGDQPALPLSRLEEMTDKALHDLVEKLKVKAKPPGDEEEAGDDADDDVVVDAEGDADAEAEVNDDEAAADAEAAGEEPEHAPDDTRQAADERAHAWACRAVEAGKLVRRPKSKKAEALEQYAAAVAAAARSLIARTVLPGEWFLVRWGGTRKGAGTFYTRPGLAVPTVQRTLRPLAYEPPPGADGRPDEMAPAAAWTPRRPEQILALKVCDPSMGSASFLVAALRFLTDALCQSLHRHGRIAAQGEQTLVTLAEGRPSEGKLGEETLPCRPDGEDFEPRLRAVLKRYVVERCLYGVDLDPLAVELGRLALWIETLDRDLPFEFLDHKLKVGNALVGCWFDRFRDYPVLAWEREGGDKTHANGVHFPKEGWTKAIRAVRDGAVKRELIELISRQRTLDDHVAGRSPDDLHDEAAAALEAMHAMRVADADQRAAYYREHLRDNAALQALRAAFDTWCALWFWPAGRLELAPTPRQLAAPSVEQRAVVRDLWRELRFFHWELEFPDVFCRERETAPDGAADGPPHAGFDAIVGNPPWETLQPNSKEYFSNLDPLYRTYGKQDALRCQTAMFQASAADEHDWLEYIARFKALASWNKHATSPFGDEADDGAAFSFGRGSKDLHTRWRGMRGGKRGYADPRHAFRHQGDGKPYTYKMFLEQAHALLRPGGELGIIVPSGLYTDKGSTDLRRLFLEQCRWQWLFGFENRLKIFDIDSRFKFCPVIVRKGGATEALRAAFMRHDLADWAEAERHVIPYGREQVARFSPRTRAILEIRQKRDLEVLEKIYANSVLLGDDSADGWGIKYAQGDFNMTTDSKLFPPRPWWEERGYVPDEYGRWIKFKGRPNPKQTTPAIGWIRLRDGGGAVDESDIEDVALPLYEGRMIGQFDFSQKGWVSGKGRKAVWEEFPWNEKRLQPQYLMSAADYRDSKLAAGQRDDWSLKLAFMDITSATNARTMIASTIPDLPCGNSAPLLRGATRPTALAAILDSVVYDFVARARCGGLHLNYFVIEETPLPHAHRIPLPLNKVAGALMLSAPLFAPAWVAADVASGHALQLRNWRAYWALTDHERMRQWCVSDAITADCFGLSFDDHAWLLRDCDLPVGFDFRKLDPKGFWRTDKAAGPELRRSVLTLVAFQNLGATIRTCRGDRDRAIAAFCGTLDPGLVPDLPFLDPTSGWQLPETLRLANYGLGHDERAKKPQPVRARLGERFLPWQLEQSPEDSWRECEIHARNILGEAGFARLQAELTGAEVEIRSDEPIAAEFSATYGRGAQRRLFPGQQTLFGAETEDSPARRKRRSR